VSEIDLSGKVAPLDRPNARFQILAISGGGYRGLYCADVLARIEGSVRMRDRFDLIAGTSIGGIIACALAVGVRASDIRDAIAEHGESIFPRQKNIQRYVRAPYSADAVAAAIEKAVGKLNVKTRLDQIQTPLLLPAVSETTAEPTLFRSQGLAGSQASSASLLDAALATAAAPTYFPSHKVGNETMLDGGLIANAPELIAMTEAMRWRKVEFDNIHILSIGTAGKNLAGPPGEAKGGGALKMGKRLFEITLTAQERLSVSQCSTLLGKRYLRLDAQPSAKQQEVLALDNASDEATNTLSLLAEQTVVGMPSNVRDHLREFLEN
jgi:patatin-like phospholipase/acyl hydrolase